MNRRVLLLLGVAILLSGVIVAACSSDTGDLEARIEALEQQQPGAGEIAALHEQVQRANMIATLNLLDGVGFHEANQAFIMGEEKPDGLNGRVLAALRAVAATDWADQFEADAQAFLAELQAFFDSLRNNDVETLRSTSQTAHDRYHSFTSEVWAALAESAGLGTDGGAQHINDGMDMDGEENMDMMTPEGG